MALASGPAGHATAGGSPSKAREPEPSTSLRFVPMALVSRGSRTMAQTSSIRSGDPRDVQTPRSEHLAMAVRGPRDRYGAGERAAAGDRLADVQTRPDRADLG